MFRDSVACDNATDWVQKPAREPRSLAKLRIKAVCRNVKRCHASHYRSLFLKVVISQKTKSFMLTMQWVYSYFGDSLLYKYFKHFSVLISDMVSMNKYN